MQTKTQSENCNYCRAFKVRGSISKHRMAEPSLIRRANTGKCLKDAAAPHGPKDRYEGEIIIADESDEVFTCFEAKP